MPTTLSKILANWFKVVIPLIIGSSQGEAMWNPQILDGVLITNEHIDSRKIPHKEGAIF